MNGRKLLDNIGRESAEDVKRWSAMRAGVALYGLASLACGMMDLIWGDFDSAHQPIQAFGDHIPGRGVLAYLTGVVMLAGGIAILWRRGARAGAAALAATYLVFALFWVPRLYTAPHFLGVRIPVYIGVLAGLGMELIAFAGGALVYASQARRNSFLPQWSRTIQITRWVFGLCSIDFGLNHLVDIKDCLVYVPKSMPFGQEFWVVVTGICFVVAGLAILTGIQDVLAARLLALMFFTFNMLALPQFIFADPKNHAAWGGNAFNLALVAANWIFADAISTQQQENQNQKSANLATASTR